MRKDHALMLSIILIAVSIGTISLVNPVANFTIPANSFVLPVGSTVSEPPKVGAEEMGMTGWVIIEVYDKDGNLKYYSSSHNLIVDKGNESTSDKLFGTTFTADEAGEFTFIQLGTGTTAPDEADTDCETIAGSKIDGSVANHPTLIGAIINATGDFGNQFLGASISEICLTNSGTNATLNLFSRQTFTPFVFNSGDTINATWTITAIDHDGN